MSTPRRRAPKPRPAAQSPVVTVTRQIKGEVRLHLFVRAGGRCQFDGCNRYLMEHHLTLTAGNFAQMAHVVAFQEDGPRGRDPRRPADINSLDNLMLLCPVCHKLIDDEPAKFTRRTLEGYKAAHEKRIKHVTGLGPKRKTAVIVFKALINGQTVMIPHDQIFEATSPRYPSATLPTTIDLTAIAGSDSAFMKTACKTIGATLDRLFAAEGEAATADHVSVFAIGPMPLLMCLGRLLSNKVPSDLYQRHRDTEKWTWKRGGQPVSYVVRQLKQGDKNNVALVLSLSGSIKVQELPAGVQQDSTIYEITLKDQTPRPTFLRTRQDLERFRVAYQEAIGLIAKNHGVLKTIDVFPAVPAPVAVLCGRELLPKVHPKLRVFDYDKAEGGFKFKLEV
jgi:hypothetical protein